MDRNGEFCAGFKDGALEAKYVCSEFEFKTTIPLRGHPRNVALYNLAERIVDKNIPFCGPLPKIVDIGPGYEVLSSDQYRLLFRSAAAIHRVSR